MHQMAMIHEIPVIFTSQLFMRMVPISKFPTRNLVVSRISASAVQGLSRNTSDHTLERNQYNYQPMDADPSDRQLSIHCRIG